MYPTGDPVEAFCHRLNIDCFPCAQLVEPAIQNSDGIPSIIFSMFAGLAPGLNQLELPDLYNDKNTIPVQQLREEVLYAVQQSRKDDACVVRENRDGLHLVPYEQQSHPNPLQCPQGGTLMLQKLQCLKRLSLGGKVGRTPCPLRSPLLGGKLGRTPCPLRSPSWISLAGNVIRSPRPSTRCTSRDLPVVLCGSTYSPHICAVNRLCL